MFCLVMYFHIAFICVKFDTAFCIFIVMSLLKLNWLSSVPPRYFTSQDIYVVSLPVVNDCLGIFCSWALEPKVRYSVLVFSLNLTVSIQDFITARVCSSFLCVPFCCPGQRLGRTSLGSDHLQIHLSLCLLTQSCLLKSTVACEDVGPTA